MKVRKISTTAKFIFAVAVLLLISDIILAFVIYHKSNQMLINQIKNKAESIASAVPSVIDGDIIATVQPGAFPIMRINLTAFLKTWQGSMRMRLPERKYPTASEPGAESSGWSESWDPYCFHIQYMEM